MDPVFLFKIILSFFVGSVWVTLATVAGEKYGTKKGGPYSGSSVKFYYHIVLYRMDTKSFCCSRSNNDNAINRSNNRNFPSFVYLLIEKRI